MEGYFFVVCKVYDRDLMRNCLEKIENCFENATKISSSLETVTETVIKIAKTSRFSFGALTKGT